MKGAGKKVFVYQPIKQEPELMYKIFDGILTSVDDLHREFRIFSPPANTHNSLTINTLFTDNTIVMKKYILIQNDGEIETNSFELIGASTKRDEKGKIGFFGSGLKYSIAYMMRKGIEFRIFSGLNQLKFSTTKEQLKGKDFERICINGKETSYTVTMGPTWTKDWFVLREIYCNALDEGTCLLVKSTEEVRPSADKTRIYVELTPELQEVVGNWDAYFSDERTPLFTSAEVFTGYMSQEDGGVRDQQIAVFQKTKGILYRRGIRVYDSSRFMYDYGMNHININEDRTAKATYMFSYSILGLFITFANEGYIKSVLREGKSESLPFEYEALNSYDDHGKISEKWIEFSESNILAVREKSGNFSEFLNNSKKEVFLIPTSLARFLKKGLPGVKIIGMDNVIGNVAFSVVEPTAKMNFLLKEVLHSLREMKYEVPYEIHVAEFEMEEILGHADIPGQKIYIAAKTFDTGRREIAMTLIEETEHIKSKFSDRTREFQTHIFSQWLKSMEEANGLFL
jgi:hypothetical protein